MEKASSRLQQLKEQLLQAIDAQNNETRLGKLINDVRKRSTDEDLVKRLKNLVRHWQKLAGVNEAFEKAAPSHVYKASSSPAKHVPRSTQTLSENYSQKLFPNNMNHKDEITQRSKTNYPTNFRKSKIPILANKLYSSSFKHVQYTSLRRSLSSQHSQDDRNIINRDKQRQVTSVSHSNTELHSVVKKPAQSNCITSSDLLNVLKPAVMNVSLAEVSSTMTDTNMTTFDNTMRKNQYNNHTPKSDGRLAEDVTKMPTDELTHDSLTQQIRLLSNKSFAKDCQRSTVSDVQNLNLCSLQQTNWREKSQSKIHNTLMTSERLRMDFSVAENYRKEYTCIADFPMTDLPGVSREITERDLFRIRRHRWHGVNGCYDNQNNWYDWTQAITLHPYRDGSTLRISPYVGIDYRL